MSGCGARTCSSTTARSAPADATLTPAAREAMRLAARTEGIFLDPTYTARALAGLIARVAGGGIKREDRTVFMHTGGLPGLFGHPDFRA